MKSGQINGGVEVETENVRSISHRTSFTCNTKYLEIPAVNPHRYSLNKEDRGGQKPKGVLAQRPSLKTYYDWKKKKILLVFLKDSKCHLLSGGKEGDTLSSGSPNPAQK